MPDSITPLGLRRTALQGRPGDSRASAGVPMARFSLRVSEAAAHSLGLPTAINSSNTRIGHTAFCLGPDEFLLLLPEGESPAINIAEPYSLVDISHRQTAILLHGPHAAAMLNAGCPLDLDEPAFPIGMATRTMFMKADIVLWRTGTESFHIEVWRSFAPYVWSLLEVIGQEYK
jgi:sarcosine oxidase subunit gamma